MTTKFRPATPNDAEFLGWVMVMAARGHLGRGWFDIVLQRPEDFCVAFCAKLAKAQAKSWWHHSLFTIAEVDGKVAAAACIFPDETPYTVSGQAMAEAARHMGISDAEQAQLWPRGKFILSATSGEDEWLDHRKRGDATRLPWPWNSRVAHSPLDLRNERGWSVTRANQLSHRQRTGRKMLSQLRIRICGRQSGRRVRGRDGRTWSSTVGAEPLIGTHGQRIARSSQSRFR